MYQSIDRCRICGNPHLQPMLSLGEQALTGLFPRNKDLPITRGPLDMVLCSGAQDGCGLVQLRHSFQPDEMYGDNYGYRSSLNKAMVEHLRQTADHAQSFVSLTAGDVVLDIGSNDGTSLSFYPENGPMLVGMDPTAAKFGKYYRSDIRVVADFFSAKRFLEETGGKKAKIVTSIAMFYDLERPLDFVRQIASILHDDGVWHLEQSYLPAMLDATAYDTICHEHIEYYALAQIKWMTDRADLKIIDVSLNDTNGGSFAVTLAKSGSAHRPRQEAIDAMLAREASAGLDTPAPYQAFGARVKQHRADLLALIEKLHREGKRVLGYGASTKGNVILQYCQLTSQQIPCFADVNADKHGCVTPGTNIPIVSEAQARAMKPDYFLVMPWHFRTNLVQREQAFLASGGRMIFPLPRIEVVGS